MTSLTYSAYMFVFVFLNAMDLSKEGCYDYLDVDKWKNNLTDTVSLVVTEDPKDRVNCTLETECLGGREAACHLLVHCFFRNNVMTKSPECEASSEGIPFYHFMCLIVNDIMPSSKACEYDTVCKIHSKKAPTYFVPTTTQTTTTTLSESTTAAVATSEPTTTTLPETTTTSTTTTTTLLLSSIAILEPTTTTLPVLPSPIKSAIETLEPTKTTTTTTTLAEGEGKAKRNGDEQPEILKDTTAENLKYLLALSLLFNAILPPAVYFFMRHRWRRDRLHWTLTRVSSGGVTGDQPKTESDAPPASASRDVATELLLQTYTHSEDTIHTQL